MEPHAKLTWFYRAMLTIALGILLRDAATSRLLLERIDERQLDFERRLTRIEAAR